MSSALEPDDQQPSSNAEPAEGGEGARLTREAEPEAGGVDLIQLFQQSVADSEVAATFVVFFRGRW